jgi:biopolymer transport protein ExbD
MDKTSDSDSSADSQKFGLGLPSRDFHSLQAESNAPGITIRDSTAREKNLHDAEIKYKAMGWKGIDEEEEPPQEDDFSVIKKPIPEDELDMTPMVDVTFLLLIFFMVTASFTLQKSLQQPKSQTEDPSNVLAEPPEEDFIEITIDQNNNYYITTRDFFEKEAPSEREMRAILRDAKENSSAEKLVIKAHLDSKHSRLITAWDAGMSQGLQIELRTTEQDY